MIGKWFLKMIIDTNPVQKKKKNLYFHALQHLCDKMSATEFRPS